MANKTLLQTRTDYPAVTPIDPDECLILDQQTDRPEGEQSTVATLSELIATGGRTVTTAVSYETLYADSVVNVSAASITITVGSVMRNGSRLLIRRTSAYDGNPVTITPPPGATFEGLSSITLYGQYSYVELERISATVFAVKDLKDEYVWDSVTGARIRRRWGQLSEKEIIGTTAAAANVAVNLAHGLDLTKIVSASGMVRRPDSHTPMPYTYYGDFTNTVTFYCNSASVYVLNSTALGAGYFSQPFTVMLHYREW